MLSTQIPKLERVKAFKETQNMVIAFSEMKELKKFKLKKDELDYLMEAISKGEKVVEVNQYFRFLFLIKLEKYKAGENPAENNRKHGAAVRDLMARHKLVEIAVAGPDEDTELQLAEGLILANYQFTRYRSEKPRQAPPVKSIEFDQDMVTNAKLKEIQTITEATYMARDLVNEPNSYLNAVTFAKHMKEICESAGCAVTVHDKGSIEKLHMGGLLAVNKGSLELPTFTVIEWKPKKPVNSQPVVFVGKGVVYDTGGLSLKPTPNSMDTMKCDMAGGAAVACAMYALAKLKSSIHVIGLVPATDNRPGGNAYAPGDIINMMNGKRVEVMNTDAEGRMILADALTYSDRYEPALVISAATLTGAAMRAIGTFGIVGMGNASPEQMNQVRKAGERVYERVVEFPFWAEYEEEIKSEIADLKNLGSDLAGAITAGKFLANFTRSPLIHLDIAGPAFLMKHSSYRRAGGTGVGVRLFVDFILNYHTDAKK